MFRTILQDVSGGGSDNCRHTGGQSFVFILGFNGSGRNGSRIVQLQNKYGLKYMNTTVESILEMSCLLNIP